MNRQSTTTVSAIQLVMAGANPLAFRDGIVLGSDHGTVTLGLLDGSVEELRVVGGAVDLATGAPVAYHPVAEILAAGSVWVTARR